MVIESGVHRGCYVIWVVSVIENRHGSRMVEIAIESYFKCKHTQNKRAEKWKKS